MTRTEKTAGVALIVGALVLILLLRDILAPFLIGLAIAYLGDPLVDRLERWRLSRTVAVTVVFVFLTILVSGAVLILVPVLLREVVALLNQVPLLINWLQTAVSPIIVESFGVDPFAIDIGNFKEAVQQHWQQAGSVAGRLLQGVSASGVALLAWIANLVLIPVVAFYLMRDWDSLMARLVALVPRDMEREVRRLAGECDEVLSAFLRGQMLIMVILGLVYAIGLFFVGLDLAFLIGMIAGLASIVPYLGFIVGFGAAAVAALFQFGDPLMLVWVLAVFGVGQALEGMVLTPLLVGDRIGLHPVAVIFAILAGGQLFGFVGILLALPVAAVVMVFVRHLHGRYLASEYYDAPAGVDDEDAASGASDND